MTDKRKKASLAKKLYENKLAGRIAETFSEPAVNYAFDYIKKTNEKRESMVELPNVVGVNFDEAKELLEKRGFDVVKVSAFPKKKYSQKELNTVISMHPQHKRVEPNTVIKLHVMTEHTLDQLNQDITIPPVKGKELNEALEFLKQYPITVETQLIKPHRKHATTRRNVVIETRPRLLNVKPHSTITLLYLDEETQNQSVKLEQEHELKNENTLNKVKSTFKKLKLFSSKSEEDIYE